MKASNRKNQSGKRYSAEENETIQVLKEYTAHLESILVSYELVDNSFAEWKNKIVYPKSADYYVELQNNCMNYLEKFLSKNFGINLFVPVTFEANVLDHNGNENAGAYWKAEFIGEESFKIKIERFKIIYEIATNLTPQSYLELVIRTVASGLQHNYYRQKNSTNE